MMIMMMNQLHRILNHHDLLVIQLLAECSKALLCETIDHSHPPMGIKSLSLQARISQRIEQYENAQLGIYIVYSKYN